MESPLLKVHPSDNIVVALQSLKGGSTVRLNGSTYTLLEDIPSKHKFAGVDFAPGDEVIMYGVLVGKATQPIPSGARISRENVTHSAGEYAVKERRIDWEKPDISQFQSRTFMGFHRPDGKVGTMNYWLVVFCAPKPVTPCRSACWNFFMICKR